MFHCSQNSCPKEAKTFDDPASGAFIHSGEGKVNVDDSPEENTCQSFIVHST